MVETFRAKATQAMANEGAAHWALSMGRQRLGLLTLQSSTQLLQHLTLPRLNSATNQVDGAALDLLRDRERGVPRFNEFRRQCGLRRLTRFDDFSDACLVDNIEGVDTVVGWRAEYTRPHGFAISETPFQVFIHNASRRLFSDRFCAAGRTATRVRCHRCSGCCCAPGPS